MFTNQAKASHEGMALPHKNNQYLSLRLSKLIKILSILEIAVFVSAFITFLYAASKTHEGSYASKTVLFIINYIQASATYAEGSLVAFDNIFNPYSGSESILLVTDFIFKNKFQYDLEVYKQADYMAIPNYFASDQKFAIILKRTSPFSCVGTKIELFNQKDMTICNYANASDACTQDTCTSYALYLDDSFETYRDNYYNLFTTLVSGSAELLSLTSIEIIVLLNNIALNTTFDVHLYYDIKSSGIVMPSYKCQYTNNNKSAPFVGSWNAYLIFAISFILIHTASLITTKMYELCLIRQRSMLASTNGSIVKLTRWGKAYIIIVNKWFIVILIYAMSILMVFYWYSLLIAELSKTTSKRVGVVTNEFYYLNNASINISISGIILIIESMRYIPLIFNTGNTLKVFQNVGSVLLDYFIFLFLSLLAFAFASYFYYGFAAFKFNSFLKSFLSWFSILFGQTSSYKVMIDYNITFGLLFFILFLYFELFLLTNISTVLILESVHKQKNISSSKYKHIYWTEKLLLHVKESCKPKIEVKTLLNGNDLINSNALRNAPNAYAADQEKGIDSSKEEDWECYQRDYHKYKPSIKLTYSTNEELSILKSNDPFITSEYKSKRKFEIKRKSCMSNWKSLSFVFIVLFSYIIFLTLENFDEDNISTEIYQIITRAYNSYTGYVGYNLAYFMSFNDMYNWALNFIYLFTHVSTSFYFPNGYRVVDNRVQIKFKKGMKSTQDGKTVYLTHSSKIEDYERDNNEDTTLPELDDHSVIITPVNLGSHFYFLINTTVEEMATTMSYLVVNKIAADQLWYLEVSFNLIKCITPEITVISNCTVIFMSSYNGNLINNLKIRVKYITNSNEYHPISQIICMTILLCCAIANNLFLIKYILYKNRGYKKWLCDKNFDKTIKLYRNLYKPENFRRIAYVFDLFTCIEIVYTVLLYIVIGSLYVIQARFYNASIQLNKNIHGILEAVNDVRESYMYHERMLAALYIVGALGSLRILQTTKSFKIIMGSIFSSFIDVFSQFFILFILVVGCWGICVLCLSSYTLKFSDFPTSIASLFSFIHGNFEFDELSKSNYVMSIIFIIVFMLVTKLYIFNIITAIFTSTIQTKIISSDHTLVKEPNFFKTLFLRKSFKPIKAKAKTETECSTSNMEKCLSRLNQNLKVITIKAAKLTKKEDSNKIQRLIKEADIIIKDAYDKHKRVKTKETFNAYIAAKSKKAEIVRNILKLYHYQIVATSVHTKKVMTEISDLKRQLNTAIENKGITVKMIGIIH